MGSMVGHVLPGLCFFIIGLWHLFSNIKLNLVNTNSYKSLTWFPTSKLRYLELYFIMLGSSISIAMELFIGPAKHQPFDPDFTIPSHHLRNFEHSLISSTILVYAFFAIVLDQSKLEKHKNGLTHLLGSVAFGQELLLFHLHSTDHIGVEAQYHLFLQILVVISLATTLMGIGFERSFLVCFVRSVSIVFQGIWFIVMGFMIYTPSILPKGCLLISDDGHYIVECSDDEALHRAKSLVNIEFSYYVIGVAIFVMSFYSFMVNKYGETVQYSSLRKEEMDEECQYKDLDESQMKIKLGESDGFVHMGK